MAVGLHPRAHPRSRPYPVGVVQISRRPRARPSGSRAAATWTSAWVSTPTMTPAVSCGMLTVAILVSVTAVVEGWCVSGAGGQHWDESLAQTPIRSRRPADGTEGSPADGSTDRFKGNAPVA